MSTTLLPAPKDIRDLLTDLVGREVTVAPGEPVMPTPREKSSVSIFVDPQLKVLAVCVMDLPLSGWTAAALALLPPGGVQDAVADGELYPMHVEALYEVVNVLSSIFNTPGAPHAKLHALHAPGETIPLDVLGIASSLGNRIDLDATVAGYGKGKISIVLPF
ncbi:hypothetical protein GB931_19655 [Modestobacter sp. I12A-02628]|uniref:Chemotaxis phosphatase CheX-like domain-containing protein n=1 Tax=Goekera deserti TaxID=2497753 RepID=A0A7K3WFU7_9ACTN|nr:hypothetical protein [Goekera deserti]MPR00095.1 hypothetical protein [Goekera deserti]NDI49874.1 hypothetical protein [Goekera deserti]NEL55236.1 hypothetical protein [Goekera deserti]